MIKEKIYNFLVRKNERVQYEYERYVREHLEEHHLHHFRHIRLLIKLNWFYRVKKCNTPYLYWDVPLLALNDKCTPDNSDIPVVAPAKPPVKAPANAPAKPPVKAPVNVPAKSQSDFMSGNAFCGSETSEVKKVKKTNYNLRPSLTRIMYEMRDVKLVFFDIFDTLLLRPFANPKDVFYILAEKFGEMDFYNLRIRCEKEARDIKECSDGTREVTIYDIYNRINYYTGIDVDYGVKTELETEMDLLYTNEYTKYIFDCFKDNGIPIVIVSDMYYPENIIEKILQKNGISGYEHLYVSCDYGCTKAEGKLFEYAMENYGDIDKKNIRHIDDNYGIIKKAREIGIGAWHYALNVGLSNQFRPSYLSPMVGSAYKGVVANYLNHDEERYPVPYEYGFMYGGIMILGYCSYIHRQCIQEGIKKVFFVSRDGDIIKRVWDFLFDDIPSDYVLISRTCLTRLSAEVWKKMFIECVVDRISTKIQPLTVREVLELYELTNLLTEIGKYDLEEDMLISRNNNSEVVDKFRNFIEYHVDEAVRIYEKSNSLYKKYIDNLLKNVGDKIAIVDAGWRGTGGITIAKVVNKVRPDVKVINYLLGCRQPVNSPEIRQGKIRCYLFSSEDNYYALNAHKEKTNYYYELLLMSATPSFEYFYEDDIGRLKMKGSKVEMSNYPVVSMIQQGIMDFVKEYTFRFRKYKEFYHIPALDVTQILYNIMNNDEYFKKYFSQITYSPEVGKENARFGEWIK